MHRQIPDEGCGRVDESNGPGVRASLLCPLRHANLFTPHAIAKAATARGVDARGGLHGVLHAHFLGPDASQNTECRPE